MTPDEMKEALSRVQVGDTVFWTLRGTVEEVGRYDGNPELTVEVVRTPSLGVRLFEDLHVSMPGLVEVVVSPVFQVGDEVTLSAGGLFRIEAIADGWALLRGLGRVLGVWTNYPVTGLRRLPVGSVGPKEGSGA